MSTFLRTTFWTSISSLIRITANFVISKCIAVRLGPTGLMLWGQISNFITIISTLNIAGLQNGVVKFTASYASDNQKLINSWKTTLFIFAGCCSFILLLQILFLNYLNDKIFYNQLAPEQLYVLMGVGIASSIVLITTSVLNGLRKVIQLSILGMLANLLLMILCYLFLDKLSVPLLVMLNFCAFGGTALYAGISFYKEYSSRKEDSLKPSMFKEQFNFSVMGLFASFSSPLVYIIIRLLVESRINSTYSGGWEALNRISAGYMIFFSQAISIYFLPKFSQSKLKDIQHEIVPSLKILVGALFISAVGIIVLKDFIIQILYSKDFLFISEFVPYQIIGDFFRVIAWVGTFYMMSQGMTKTFVLIDVIFSGTLLVGTYLLTDKFLFQGTLVAYIINSMIFCFTVYYLIFRKLSLERE